MSEVQRPPQSLTYSQHAILDLLRVFEEKGVPKLGFGDIYETLTIGRQYQHVSGNIFKRIFSYAARGENDHWIFTGALFKHMQSLEQLGYVSREKTRTIKQNKDSNVAQLEYKYLDFSLTQAGRDRLKEKTPARMQGFQFWSFGYDY